MKKIKPPLFVFFILLLTLPMIQLIFPFKEVQPLNGAISLAEKPKWSWKNWNQGKFSDEFDKYWNDNIGFRPWLVRFHNQIGYSVFNELNAKGVIRGKENYLYEINYLKAYNGEDFLGSKTIEEKVKDFAFVQEELAKRNKTLIVCLAPGKGSFYPEYFPKDYMKPETDSTNYKQYARILKKHDVHIIDMNHWFLAMKDTSRYSLYPKYGIHWSHYGMLLAADSIAKYIGDKREVELPSIKFEKMNLSEKYQFTDYDIGEGLNLLFQLKSEALCYPEISFQKNEKTVQPKTLVISDSFYWDMFNKSIGSEVFSYGGFWYYNQQIYPDSYDVPISVDEVDFLSKMLENDVILLMVTEANLPNFSWGFIEKAKEVLAK